MPDALCERDGVQLGKSGSLYPLGREKQEGSVDIGLADLHTASDILQRVEGAVAAEHVADTTYVCGIDEVGRGCIAGPVVACAVLLPERYPFVAVDSKRCSEKKRRILAQSLDDPRVLYAFGVVENAVIDTINILQATFYAMAIALLQLPCIPPVIAIDGSMTIPLRILKHVIACGNTVLEALPQYKNNSDDVQERSLFDVVRQCPIIKGDACIPAISAAAIMAKVYRDALMQKYDKQFPAYNFAKNKGYGTKEHYLALRAYGASPIHRLSFSGVVH